MGKLKTFISSLDTGTERTLCVINGVIGDTLEARKTRFALKMALFTEQGNELSLTPKTSSKLPALINGKVCILAHGSCSSQKGWNFKEDPSSNYGLLLKRDFGYTPFFLRYNSGLHISTNGKRLSDLLEKLMQTYRQNINEIIFIGHSMGGLVFRSACHYGQNKKWVKEVKKIFYIASPHLGTHMERLGKLTTTILNTIPNPITKLLSILGNMRSAGIKDLGHGYLTDEDWQHNKSESVFYWHHNHTPLLQNTNHYLICGTISKKANSKMGHFFGDGMVHTASGTGRGFFSSSTIPFSKKHCKIIPGISHAQMQKSPRVYEHIKNWCSNNT